MLTCISGLSITNPSGTQYPLPCFIKRFAYLYLNIFSMRNNYSFRIPAKYFFERDFDYFFISPTHLIFGSGFRVVPHSQYQLPPELKQKPSFVLIVVPDIFQ